MLEQGKAPGPATDWVCSRIDIAAAIKDHRGRIGMTTLNAVFPCSCSCRVGCLDGVR
ncbi:hypothetical protein B0I35DRAFT_423178 [Stachybotrys elegans]|uniref:Uncharacterized protein n=1 Tax=Stachybotrys elegans TaxID=80388 RepID=A0A8K0WVF5_9HYPO|nr:hypothetical protein B0I35DRAFT_423178 [Stachybotrys elegans]